MTASWDIRAQNQVQVAILHTENTTVAWAFGLRNLIIPGPPILPLVGMPFDHARNAACVYARQSGAEWLFFLDSDVIPPNDTIPRLISHGKPIISGVYCRRSPPHGRPVYIRDGEWGKDFHKGGIVEADVVGAGCLLIHRSVLEKLPPLDPKRGKHWFDWRSDMGGSSEDFTFCNHARSNGYKILIDTSIICRHVGWSQAGVNSLEPLECPSVT